MIAIKSIETRVCTVTLDDNGVLWLLFSAPNVVVKLQDSEAIVAARRELAGDRPQLLCVDLRNTPRPDKDARDYTDSDEVVGITQAMAMITDSALSRMIGNFFLGLNRGSFPTRLFSNEEDAVAWLGRQGVEAA